MSITDELREYARIHQPYKSELYNAQCADEITAIADRIDAEHDKALNSVDDAYDSGYNVGYDEGFASADDWLAQHEDAMSEHGWIRLPKDADGEYISVGDVMESKDGGPLFGEGSFEVRAMRCDECGWEVYDRLGDRYAPSLLRHHHAPTVEDVLREMLFRAHIYDKREMELLPDLIADYAAKLRLVEGEDE